MSRMRPKTPIEENNCLSLQQNGIDYALLQITPTGIKKKIFDATREVQAFLSRNEIHDYSSQQPESQEASYKVTCQSFIFDKDRKRRFMWLPSLTVFYRSKTKDGAFRRMNIYRIHSYTKPFDKYAIIASKDKELYLINISKYDIASFAQNSVYNPIRQLIDTYPYTKQEVAQHLRSKLSALQGQWIPAADSDNKKRPNAVGYAIEAALGIPKNSSNAPDYMGIEIKSHRENSSRKGDLFGLFPDWDISRFKEGKGKKIATLFGKPAPEVGHNSLETSFYVNTIANCGLTIIFKQKSSSDKSYVELIQAKQSASNGIRKVQSIAKWRLTDLHDRLLSKHPQTFWITAESDIDEATQKEKFLIKKIVYTKDPDTSAFDRLLADGDIRLDVSVYRRSGSADNYKFVLENEQKKGELLNIVNEWVF